MTRLELIMTKRELSTDEVRGLLGDYVDGDLDAATRAEVESHLERDPGLRAEYEALTRTLGVLRNLSRPRLERDLVADVRARLAEERRAAAEAPIAGVVPLPAHGRSRWIEWGLGAAAAAALVIGIVATGAGDPGETAAAGVQAEHARSAAVDVVGAERARVRELAHAAGVKLHEEGDQLELSGSAGAMAGFLLALERDLAASGGQIRGFLPEGVTVLTVRLTRR